MSFRAEIEARILSQAAEVYSTPYPHQGWLGRLIVYWIILFELKGLLARGKIVKLRITTKTVGVIANGLSLAFVSCRS